MTAAAMIGGVCGKESLCQAVAARFGRATAVFVGLSILVAITLFQASNNNALLMAAEGFLSAPDVTEAATETVGQAVGQGATPSIGSRLIGPAVLLGVNAVVVALLLLGRRDLYRLIERCMAVLTGAMVLAFAAGMFAAGPSASEIAGGLIPKLPEVRSGGEQSALSWLSVAALMGTTFSAAAAFYQSYQVREKGWAAKDLSAGTTDTVVGIGTLGAITAMILITAAAGLHGVIDPGNLKSAADVAMSLEPLFGAKAKIVFAIGVMAGAVSSFVVNAMIGGVVFSDSIGKGNRLSDKSVQISTIGSLLLGWAVAASVAATGSDLVSFIIVAQSLCVVVFPVLAAVILWRLYDVGPKRLVRWLAPFCWIGLIVVVLFSANTVRKIGDKLFPAETVKEQAELTAKPKQDLDVLN